MNKLPIIEKKSDPKPFTVLFQIDAYHMERCLANLGASVNIIPLSICRALKHVIELCLTKIIFQLTNQTRRRPIGVWEDMIIKVGPFAIPIDFLVLDIEPNVQTPIILGRLFLATVGAVIDYQKGMTTFNING